MDIHHDFWIDAGPSQVFRALVTSDGLDAWWTRRSTGIPRLGSVYELWFGEGHDWRGEVTRFEPDRVIEWTLKKAADDWMGTRVSFALEPATQGTTVSFVHAGWREASRHYRISCYCWAMYLRLLKRFVQHGERIPYDKRLEA